jgi:hypothetical protein
MRGGDQMERQAKRDHPSRRRRGQGPTRALSLSPSGMPRFAFRIDRDMSLADAEIEPHLFQRHVQRVLKDILMGAGPRIDRRATSECEILEFEPVDAFFKLAARML